MDLEKQIQEIVTARVHAQLTGEKSTKVLPEEIVKAKKKATRARLEAMVEQLRAEETK